MVDDKSDISTGAPKFELVGELMIDFLRYLGSHQFSHAQVLRFDLGNMTNRDLRSGENTPMILTDSAQWAEISRVAHRTFHYLVLTHDCKVFFQ
ncbi:RNA-dependent RNA polymerase [Aphelenchoides avenae]|nr:RNA-dependent RNA polymerase [Aphelenchus avenae]